MSTWNYQVGFKRGSREAEYLCSDVVYGIIEVYRNDKGEIQAYSEEFQTPCGETLQELIGDLGMMLKDANDRQALDMDNQETVGFKNFLSLTLNDNQNLKSLVNKYRNTEHGIEFSSFDLFEGKELK